MAESSPVVETVDSGSTVAPATADPGAASTPVESGKSVEGVRSESSPESGKTAETRETLLDVVRKAVPLAKGPTQDATKANAGSPEASPASNAQPGAELGPLTQKEFDSYHPRTQKRIEKFQAEQKQLLGRISSLEPQAQAAQELQTFLKQADIAKEDFGLVLDLAAAMRRGDFKAFLEGVTPYVTLAQESLGIALPADLQQAVKTGHMTEDAARYVAQQRGARQLADAKVTRLTTERTVETTQRERQNFANSVQTAVAEWEAGIRKTDPDYARKEPVVRDLLHAVIQERGPPKSPADAIAIAKAAYERANALVTRFVPTPRPTRQAPSSLTRVNGARPEPKSMLDAVRNALDAGR